MLQASSKTKQVFRDKLVEEMLFNSVQGHEKIKIISKYKPKYLLISP